MRFYQQERLIDFQLYCAMNLVLYFILTDGQTFGSSAVRIFQNFGEKLSFCYWRFPRRMLLSKVSTK